MKALQVSKSTTSALGNKWIKNFEVFLRTKEDADRSKLVTLIFGFVFRSGYYHGRLFLDCRGRNNGYIDDVRFTADLIINISKIGSKGSADGVGDISAYYKPLAVFSSVSSSPSKVIKFSKSWKETQFEVLRRMVQERKGGRAKHGGNESENKNKDAGKI